MSRPHSDLEASSFSPSIYSTYVCREPVGDVGLLVNNGPDEYTSLLRTLQRSADHWAEKDHTRTVERLQLEIARLHMQNKQWQRAMRTLVPLWQTLTWRQTGWWSMLEEVDWALKGCAKKVQDAEALLAVEWELMNRSLTKRQDSHLDYRQALKGLEGIQTRPCAVVRLENVLSCVSATFAFSQPEGNVGVLLDSQLVLSSHAHADSAPIDLAQIRIAFEGGLKNVGIYHKPSENTELTPEPTRFQQLSLQSNSTESEGETKTPSNIPSHILSASADLTLAAGETKVLFFSHLPREDGDVQVGTITIYIKEESFDLELVVSDDEQLHQKTLWVSTASGITQKALRAQRSSAVKILPKPPKMRIGLPDMLTSYYVDERVLLDIELINEEDEPVKGILDVQVVGLPGRRAICAWSSESRDNTISGDPTPEDVDEDGHRHLSSRQIAVMTSNTRQRHQLHLMASSESAGCSLRIEARYSLLSDPETPISKVFNTDVVFTQPLESTFHFAPRMHPEPWPNYFDIGSINDGQPDTDSPTSYGLSQRWSLTTRLTSLATDTLIIEDVTPKVNHMTPSGTASCRISPSNSTVSDIAEFSPGAHQSRTYTLDVQKFDLEDRQPVSMDLCLQIKYHRQSTSSQSTAGTTTTMLAIPPHPLSFGEPRCLAWTAESSPTAGSIHPHSVSLTYTIENPSSYTLIFSLNMDNNEAFAFAGPKSLTLQLLPLSRRAVEYRLLPLGTREDVQRAGKERGSWIWPHCVVVDTGFRKTLRVLPAAESLKAGRRGEIGIWIAA